MPLQLRQDLAKGGGMLLAGMCATCPTSHVLVPHCPPHMPLPTPTLSQVATSTRVPRWACTTTSKRPSTRVGIWAGWGLAVGWPAKVQQAVQHAQHGGMLLPASQPCPNSELLPCHPALLHLSPQASACWSGRERASRRCRCSRTCLPASGARPRWVGRGLGAQEVRQTYWL